MDKSIKVLVSFLLTIISEPLSGEPRQCRGTCSGDGPVGQRPPDAGPPVCMRRAEAAGGPVGCARACAEVPVHAEASESVLPPLCRLVL